MRPQLLICLPALAALGALGPCAAAGEFEPIGLGGGGGLFSPAASPHDPNLMFVACDMSGYYRSEDGGKSWRMLDKRQMRSVTTVAAFHPTDPATIYAWGCGELRVSHDRGLTWAALIPDDHWRGGTLTHLAVARADPRLMLAGGDAGAYVSTDAGASWAAPLGVSGKVVGLAFLPPGPDCFVATDRGIFRSSDRGATWQVCSDQPARGLAGGCDEASGEAILYCTVPSRAEGGRYVGGVLKSTDHGRTWAGAMSETINMGVKKADAYGVDDVAQYEYIGGCETRPRTVWVTTRGTGYWPPHHWTVYRSDDAGATWRTTFTGDPRFPDRNVELGWLTWETCWGFGGPALGFSVCAGNPDVAMYTNAAELFITSDGGKSWHNGFCHVADGGAEGRGKAWVSTGLNVTSCWDLALDPFRPGNVYIGYTDIGFARSEDGGKSWQYAAGTSPWANTFYRVICDPDTPGLLYAACSNQHDIPHWGSLEGARGPGGVCVSRDFGQTWAAAGAGLPPKPCTCVALDPKSPKDSRTLYAALFTDGVYKSTDGGRSWRRASEGLGAPTNHNVYSVRLHPDGTLFCSVTGSQRGRDFALPSGLWRSRDGAASWEPISSDLKLRWAGDFDFDPTDSRVLYLTAATPPGYAQGGIYKTTDGGVTWRYLMGDGVQGKPLPRDILSYSHCFFVKVDERRPSRVFLGAPSHGLFMSEDAGETWREVRGLPFTACQRVTTDPRAPDLIWVTTFGGGVWRGKP